MAGKPIVLRRVGDGWSGEAVVRDLPPQPTPLVDRIQDVRSARDQLLRDDVRLLTLVGVAGVGKSRLAVAIAGELAENFGGVWFVDLVPVADPNLVPTAIARALGVRVAANRAVDDELRRHLQDQDGLLVLDNFEHLLPAATPLAGLLESCRSVKLLVTSREPLHLRWEHCFAVLPLALPDQRPPPDLETVEQAPAVQLFVQRARSVNRHFQLTAANAQIVAEICIRLDGVPLALEMAAGYSYLLSPEAILEQLDENLYHLRGSTLDRPARHQSLAAAIDWSYRQLTEEERSDFCRLGVFVGGFTIEAAETIGVGHPDALRILDSLVDKSLVQVDARPAGGGSLRFRLTEAARACALHHLNAVGEPLMLRARHAMYYRELAERAEARLRGPEQGPWYAYLDREHDNVRAALIWAAEHEHWALVVRLAGAMTSFWLRCGRLAEARRWLGEAVARRHAVVPELQWRALDRAGILAGWLGDQARARQLLEEAVALARELGDLTSLAHSLGNLTLVAWLHGHGEWVRDLPDDLDLFRTMAHPWECASLLLARGMLLAETDARRAGALLEEALATFRRVGDRHGVALANVALAAEASKAGDVERAVARLWEGLECVPDVGDPLTLATVVDGVVRLEADSATATQRLRLLAAASHLRDSLGLPRTSRRYPDYSALANDLRAAVGEERFARSWAAGEALPMDQIFAEARKFLHLIVPTLVVPAVDATALSAPQSVAQPSAVETAEAASARERELLHLISPEISQGSPSASPIPAIAAVPVASERERKDLHHDAPGPINQSSSQVPAKPTTGPPTAPTPHSAVALSEREREVLRLVAQGLSNKQIARALHLSDRTVKTYVTLAFNKLGADNRAHAAVLATQRNLL